MNKKVFIIGLIVLFLFLFVSFFLSRIPDKELVKAPSVLDAQTIGTSPRYPTTESPVIFTLSPSLEDPPLVLPEYGVTFSPSLDNTVIAYARSLGFGSPTRSSERFLEWIDEKGRLLYDKGLFSLSLTQFSGSNPFYSSVEEVVSSVSQRLFFSPQMSLRFLYTESPSFSDGVSEQKKFVTEYAYVVSGLPVLYSATDPSVFIVHSYETEKFYSLMVRVPPETINNLVEKPLFTKNQIPLLLEQNKGVLQSVGSVTNPNSVETTPSFSSVEIQSLSVAYLLIPEEQKLVPVYILKGVGTGQGAVQSVQYIMRAAP